MQDFLTFKTFITPSLLLIFYYVGAILMPIVSWKTIKYLKKHSTINISNLIFKRYFHISLGFFLLLLCMEIFWRMMFEFLIAYFNMHEALVNI